ncbi:response regulator transcription factor [Neobacillus dielmonensis]|uniref:response regulator transcription factor n=1 Tax=Neobacillus dielmonensis TaxID=1347369 RepID=UPI0005AAB02B|nr:response regulator [Neobacillus dielmonensis]
MYKVMLVDDDYPVVEFLSETVQWKELGITLQSTHENGISALERAMEEMPDILITDIGMPKMNGIELTKRLKEINPDLQVIILSCHSEFEFAKQALKLQVQDYLVKDTFDPQDLYNVVLKVKESLDDKKQQTFEQLQMQHLLDRNRENVKDQFIRRTIHQTQIPEKEWFMDAKALGLELNEESYMATLLLVHDFHKVNERFQTEDMLTYALNNVMEEVMKELNWNALHFCFSPKEFILLFPYSQPINLDPFNKSYENMKKLQKALKGILNIEVSFLIGENVSNLSNLKQELSQLLNAKHQSFYMQKGSIVKRGTCVPAESEDLFSYYDKASSDFRELLLTRDESKLDPIFSKWLQLIEEKNYSPEQVKEWILKLLLDLKIRLQASHYFRSGHSMECLHQKILTCDFLCELKFLLIDYFKTLLHFLNEVYNRTKRKEILDAIGYVSAHLEKRISLEEVASHLYLNQSYFSRLFKKEMGETFVEFVTKMKVARAKELLEQTAGSVGEICERLGYDNQSYFIKLFKTHVGVTPVEYRSGKVSIS